MAEQKMKLELDAGLALKTYITMAKIREFEEQAKSLFERGVLAGFLHSSVGQEAVAAGVAACLREDDYLVSTHRGHGHILAKGATPHRMFAELYGKETGYCRGKGGSMHIMDFSLGILGANGIVGAGIPIAVGAGLSAQIRETDQVVACLFGDGAANEGAFHEGLNLASIWQLPVIFVCENNQYAESTPIESAIKAPIHARAGAYGLPGFAVDGNDVIAVYKCVREAVERARRGEGASLIECETYRWYGHYVGDPGEYRDNAEVEAWKAKDPLLRFEKQLLEAGVLDEDEKERVKLEVQQEIKEGIRFAEESQDPEPESAFEDIYAE